MNVIRHQVNRTLIKAHRIYRRKRYPCMPIIFGNSFPKSGTNLLNQILYGLCKMKPYWTNYASTSTYDGSTGRKRTQLEIDHVLKKLTFGEIGIGHLFATPENVATLNQAPFVTFFIYRDPRDVVVSHAFYVTQMALDHVHHNYYANTLKSLEERIATSITGRPDVDIEFPDVSERFKPYLPWIGLDRVLPIKFEALISDQAKIIDQILNHLIQFDHSPWKMNQQEAIQILAKTIDPSKSATFREGKVGGWRNHFSDQNKRLFKQLGGNLLIQLGYESSHDW